MRIVAALFTLAVLPLAATAIAAQTPSDSIVPLLPPRSPLPGEAATAAITKFSFISYGDTRGRHDGEQLQAEHQLVIESMLATIRRSAAAGDPIKFVLQSGDAVVDGSVAQQLSVSYIPLINRLTQDGGVPYYLSVGNHDVGGSPDVNNARRVAGLKNYFAANSRLIPPDGSPRRLNGYPTYAFGFGNTFFVAFDSNIADDTTQFDWVKKQLEGLDRGRYPNVVVFFHHPVFSSGPHGGATIEAQTATIRARWMPLFRKHHVRLLLTGHEHLYEHWVERYKDEKGQQYRMDQIVSGGGGAPLYGYVGEPDLREYFRTNMSAGVSVQHLARPSLEPGGNPFHYVVVHVDGSDINIEVVGVDWGRGFQPYRSSTAALSDKKPISP